MTAPQFRWRSDGGPAVIGHRGLGRGTRSGCRENTGASFRAAAAAGADWIETDVQPGAGGALVLHHNIRDAAGAPIASLTADQRRRQGVELLPDAFSAIPTGIGVDVELKTTPGDAAGNGLIGAVLDLIGEDRGHPFLLTSFDPSVPYAVREQARLRHRQAPPTGWITERGWPYGKAVLAAIRLGCQAAVLHADDVLADRRAPSDAPTLSETLGLIADHRLAVAVWDATPANAAALIDRGVTGLCTDQVPALRATLDRSVRR